MDTETKLSDEGSLDPEVRDDDREAASHDAHLSREFMEPLLQAVAEADIDSLRRLCTDLHAADLADILEAVSRSDRQSLIEMLGDQLPSELFSEVSGEAQSDLYTVVPNETLAEAVTELETDDAVYVLEELDLEDREEVLAALEPGERIVIEENLSFPDDSAGRLMQRDVLALPAFWTVGDVIDLLRSDDETLPDQFYDVFVVDTAHHPIGAVALSRIMRTGRDIKLEALIQREPFLIDVNADQEEVAYAFSKYHLISAAVVNPDGRLLGMVTVDDVVDVISEEAQEDILALAGVGGEAGVGEELLEVTRTRLAWLAVNLVTAILASLVIGLFDATIEQMVALAILMPIVASMGGNAGTQTMTVAVRAIATKELSATNARRVFLRETGMALANGLLLALISAGIAYLWFQQPLLSAVFAVAMVVNVVTAGASGILIPLGLSKAGIDPAIASSVFVTTITDVVGFFAFLGLAGVILL